ncbi:hypothetical protein [Streptomyces sp. NPDC018000]|uniref:hypothetical protein n=1 Tax=Streptomyces sp. NPDC018000 TaxID=3365028 RepID=UPI00378E0251
MTIGDRRRRRAPFRYAARACRAVGNAGSGKSVRRGKTITETAARDELIRRNPCRIKGAGSEKGKERATATVGIRWRLMVYLGAYGPMCPQELAVPGGVGSGLCLVTPRWCMRAAIARAGDSRSSSVPALKEVPRVVTRAPGRTGVCSMGFRAAGRDSLTCSAARRRGAASRALAEAVKAWTPFGLPGES